MRLRTRTKSSWVKANSRAGAAPGAPLPAAALRRASFTASSEFLPFVIARIRRGLEAAPAEPRRRRAPRQAARRCITQDRPLQRRRHAAQVVPLEAEAGHQLDQAAGLILETFRRRRRLLDQGCVLLRDLVHLRDGARDLID